MVVLKVGHLAGGRARGGRAQRRRWPATSACSAAWWPRRARSGPRTSTICSSWPRRSPSPGAAARGRAPPEARGLAIMTCSGGDSAQGADEAEQLGLELPTLGARDAARGWRAAADRGHGRQPARLHGDDLGRTPRRWPNWCARSARIPAIGQVLVFYDQPHGLTGAPEESWRRGARGDDRRARPAARFRRSSPRRCPSCSTTRAAWEFAQAGVAAAAGLRTGLRCAAARLRPTADDRRARLARDRRDRAARLATAASAGRAMAGRARGQGAAARRTA